MPTIWDGSIGLAAGDCSVSRLISAQLTKVKIAINIIITDLILNMETSLV